MAADRPRYQEIADDLRRRILLGLLPPGALVPSESQIRADFNVSRGTAAQALDVLRAEGLIYTLARRGSIVRRQAPTRTLTADRYQPGGRALRTEPPFLEEVTQRATVEDALPHIARELGVAEGTPLVRRRYVLHTFGTPQQITDSYLVLAEVAGSPLADLEASLEPEPAGIIRHLAELGVVVTESDETVWARMPTDDEADTLLISPDLPVLRITRRLLAGDKPVEAAVDIVIPADQVEVRYRIRL